MTESREWFAGSDLAGLPGLPSTERRIRARAARDGWTTRDRAGRGGGREYHISSLPDAARAALLLRQRAARPTKSAATTSDVAEELWSAFERKPDREKAVAQRRVEALMTVEQLVREGCQQMEAVAIVAHQVGESESTIRNWRRRVKGHDRAVWAPLLLRGYVGGGKSAEYDPRIYQMFRDLYCDLSRPPKSTCFYRVARWAAAEGLAMPSRATLYRDLDRREDPHVILLEREGERALASAFPYLERDRSQFHAMQAINADGHVLDLAVVWPDEEKERATLLTVQDLASGAVIGWKLVKSESAHEMSLTFLDVFTRLGVAEHLYLDNTLAAASKRMTAGAPGRRRFKDLEGDPIGVLPALGVNVHFVTPAHGQAKPIERSFRTLADQISKHPAFRGAYMGNSTVTKPADYGSHTITIAELEPIVRAEIDVFNAQLGRRGGVANGRSYQQVFDQSYAEHSHRIRRITESQRRLLYLVSERVTVDRRDGCVKLFGNRYWCEDVARCKGTQVVLRYHPTESLHDAVWVYRLDGTLIAQAPIYHKAGFADATAAEAHSRARQQFKRSKKDLAKKARRLRATEVAAMVPTPVLPNSPAIAATAKRIDFALPTTVEQLGITRARAAATKKSRAAVEAAVGKFAEHIEPKRRKHA